MLAHHLAHRLGIVVLAPGVLDPDLVQSRRDRCVVVVVLKKTIDYRYRSRVPPSMDGDLNAFVGSALVPDLSRDVPLATGKSDIFQKQASHPLALPGGRFRVLPDSWKVIGQMQNLLPRLCRYTLAG